MKALILAAGYATRLYPLTKDFPKPLLKVGKKTIIDYIIDRVERIKDIDEIIVITNDKFISQFQNWSMKVKSNKKLKIFNDLTKTEADKRGAIGDINFAIENGGLNEDTLIIGGDNLFDWYLEDFVRFAESKRSSSVGLYDIKDKNAAKIYGVVKIDEDNKIIDFKEKPTEPESTLVAMCLYYFPKEKLDFIREYLEIKTDKQDATGFYIDWLSKRDNVYGFIFGGHWYDIGHRDFYNEAKQTFLAKAD